MTLDDRGNRSARWGRLACLERLKHDWLLAAATIQRPELPTPPVYAAQARQ